MQLRAERVYIFQCIYMYVKILVLSVKVLTFFFQFTILPGANFPTQQTHAIYSYIYLYKVKYMYRKMYLKHDTI